MSSLSNNRYLRALSQGWGKRSVIGVPYSFLILFFKIIF